MKTILKLSILCLAVAGLLFQKKYHIEIGLITIICFLFWITEELDNLNNENRFKKAHH